MLTIYFMRSERNIVKIGFTSRSATARARELRQSFNRPYKVLATVNFKGDLLKGLAMEKMIQYIFANRCSRCEYDSKTNDHFNIDGRYSDKTLIRCFNECAEQALALISTIEP